MQIQTDKHKLTSCHKHIFLSYLLLRKVITLELLTGYRFENGCGMMIILMQQNVSSSLFMALCSYASTDRGMCSKATSYL